MVTHPLIGYFPHTLESDVHSVHIKSAEGSQDIQEVFSH